MAISVRSPNFKAFCNTSPGSLDKTFTYKVPDNLIGKVKKGIKVSIPFGRQSINGFVLSIKDNSDLDNLKEITGIINENYSLNDEL